MEKDLVPVNEEGREIVERVDPSQIIIADDGSEYVLALKGSRQLQYSSIDSTKLSFEEKAEFFNLINGQAKLINDCVNIGINLKDIYMEVVEVVDMNTKQPKKLPRIVLIDDKKEVYTCSSPTFLNKLSQLIAMVGEPKTWSTPIPIIFKKVKTNSGYNALVFETAFTTKKK